MSKTKQQGGTKRAPVWHAVPCFHCGQPIPSGADGWRVRWIKFTDGGRRMAMTWQHRKCTGG